MVEMVLLSQSHDTDGANGNRVGLARRCTALRRSVRSVLVLVLASALRAAEGPQAPRFSILDLGDASPTFVCNGGTVLLVDHTQGWLLWRGGRRVSLSVLGAVVANRQGFVAGSLYAGSYPVETWDGTEWVSYYRAALWHDGEIIPLGTLGGRSSAPTFINSSQVVVGTADDAANVRQPFVWQDGLMSPIRVDLSPSGNCTFERPLRITDAGTIFGTGTVSGRHHAVRLSPVTDGSYDFEDLGAPDGTLPEVTTFNDLGWAAGQALHPPGGIEAFQLRGGKTTWLGTLGSNASYAYCVNNIGDVVGMSNSESYRAFLWREGIMFDLNSCIPSGSGWLLVSAIGINDSGQIVGEGILNGTGTITQGEIVNGGYRAFLLDPLPETDQGLSIRFQGLPTTNGWLLTLPRQPTTNLSFQVSTDLVHWVPIAHTRVESGFVVGRTAVGRGYYRVVLSP